MKKGILTLIFTMLAMLSFAQKKTANNYFVELNMGRGLTNTHSAPVDLYSTLDADYIPEVQEPYFGNHIEFILTRRLNKSSHIGINIGYTEYSYFTSGYIQNGWGPDYKDEFYDLNKFVQTGFVYKYDYQFNKSNKLSIANSIGLEHYTPTLRLKDAKYWFQTNEFKGLNLRYKINVNYAHAISEKLDLQIGLYYMTALNKYEKKGRYMPYSLGLQIGSVFKI